MKAPKLISKANATFQELESLKGNRAKRTKLSRIFVEGVIPINALRQSKIAIEQLYLMAGARLSNWASEIVDSTPRAELYSLEPELMARISDKDNPPELIAVSRMPDTRSFPNQLSRILIMDRPSSPGNLGSVVRTCDAFGIDAVFLFGRSADPFDPKSIAASRGAVFLVKVCSLGSKRSLEDLLEQCRTRGEFPVFGSSARGNTSIGSVQRPDRFALVVGNESRGMSSYLASLADAILTIPTQGTSTSLNLSAATSILLYHLTTR